MVILLSTDYSSDSSSVYFVVKTNRVSFPSRTEGLSLDSPWLGYKEGKLSKLKLQECCSGPHDKWQIRWRKLQRSLLHPESFLHGSTDFNCWQQCKQTTKHAVESSSECPQSMRKAARFVWFWGCFTSYPKSFISSINWWRADEDSRSLYGKMSVWFITKRILHIWILAHCTSSRAKQLNVISAICVYKCNIQCCW